MKKAFELLTLLAIVAGLVFSSCVKDVNDESGNDTTCYTLNVMPNNEVWGTVLGSGTYPDGTNVTIEAVPNENYYFIKWSDEEVSNPRIVTIDSDMTLYALFSSDPDDPNPYNPFDTITPNPGRDTTQPGPNPPQPVPEGWVDLGLPSGLLWATCNVGAQSPEEYGNYYAWGETATKEVYAWSTYHYCTVDDDGNLSTLTKYNIHTLFGTLDSLTTLQALDDAAKTALGASARTPTREEWLELINNTTVEWISINGVYGRKYTAANGSSIFLPAAREYCGDVLYHAENEAFYWSASLYEASSNRAWNFHYLGDYFATGGQGMIVSERYFGMPVRAVRTAN